MKKSTETTYRALLLSVMVAMMEIDGIIDPHELEDIGDIYEDVVGFRLDAKTRSRLTGSVAISRVEALELLRTRTHLLDERQRHDVFNMALHVLRADNRAHPKEWQFLRDVGLALGIPDESIRRHLA